MTLAIVSVTWTFAIGTWLLSAAGELNVDRASGISGCATVGAGGKSVGFPAMVLGAGCTTGGTGGLKSVGFSSNVVSSSGKSVITRVESVHHLRGVTGLPIGDRLGFVALLVVAGVSDTSGGGPPGLCCSVFCIYSLGIYFSGSLTGLAGGWAMNVCIGRTLLGMTPRRRSMRKF